MLHAPFETTFSTTSSSICRNAVSPSRLVDTFPAPDNHIHTLYDNLENSMVKYADVSMIRIIVRYIHASAISIIITK